MAEFELKVIRRIGETLSRGAGRIIQRIKDSSFVQEIKNMPTAEEVHQERIRGYMAQGDDLNEAVRKARVDADKTCPHI